MSINYPHNSTTCSKQVKSSGACNRFSNIDFSFQLMNEWPWNKQISWIHNIKLDSLIFEKNNWSWRLFSLVFNPIWSICMIKSWKSMICSRDYGHLMAKSQFFAVQIQIQIPIPKKYLRCGYKGLFICRNNAWLTKNTDEGLKGPK